MMELSESGNLKRVQALAFDYDGRTDVLTVEGIKFAGDFFRMLSVSGVSLMEPIVVTKRTADGVLEVQKVTKENFQEVFK